MNKKILVSIMVIGLVALLTGAGLYAYFNDIETSSGNTFTAGTLDLKVGGQDDPYVVTVTLSNMKPGDVSPYYKWCLKNVGSIPGRLSVTFQIVSDDENGINEPEQIAENEPYGYQGARPTLGHPDRGELSEFLKPTCGWGPCGWSVPSRVISQWAVGPSPAYAGWNFGLYSWNGQTFTYGTLNPNEEIAFFFRVSLDGNLQAWDGCGWHDVNDNVIQGDSVTLNIIFHLDQIQP